MFAARLKLLALCIVVTLAAIFFMSHATAAAPTSGAAEHGILVAQDNHVDFLEAGMQTRFDPPVGDPPRPVSVRETADNGLHLFRRPRRSVLLAALNHLSTKGWEVVDVQTDDEGVSGYLLRRGS